MPNLLFYMTPGVGLNTWKRIGILDRELKPYMEYTRRGWSVIILTFDDKKLPKLPEGITAICFPRHIPLLMFPWIFHNLRNCVDVIKTNQSVRCWWYVLIAKIWHKPILLRCGYVQGEYLETTQGSTLKTKLYQLLEGWAFRNATHCVVPTKELAEWIIRKYKVSSNKITIIPNFVDTEIFKPMLEVKKIPKSIISVGRLHRVKRFDLLIRACAKITDCKLTIIGEGKERQKLELLAKELKVNLSLQGNIPNEDLPRILNQYIIFVSASLREGHPKALIEAMACGLACVCLRSPGIENILKEDKLGCLADDENDLAKKILMTMNNYSIESMNHRINFTVENFNFVKIFLKEKQLIERLISENEV